MPSSLTEAWLEDEANQGKSFPSYARLLPKRGTSDAESPFSWTVDFAARRKQTREEMKPHVEKAERTKEEVVSLKEKLKALKKATTAPKAIETTETRIQELEKEAREAHSKADAIGASVFDLKAVNPNVVLKLDNRTPLEVIQSIEEHGKLVSQSLATLKGLITA